MKALTLTIASVMTSNYGENLGNVASTQKIYMYGKTYSIRSRESIKNAICVQSGFYDSLETSTNSDEYNKKKKVATKLVTSEKNAANCRALEGGYMSAVSKNTYIRNSSFYLTDAVSTEPFINEARFHNNLYLATHLAKHDNKAKDNDKNLHNNAAKNGLMPYQYEYDKSLKIYSITIDLEKIGVDENFAAEADNQEKCERVIALLDAVENLSLIVKGNLDNAEPVFVIGGLTNRKTHMFENAVTVANRKLNIQSIKQKFSENFNCGILRNGQFLNEDDIIRELNPMSVPEFFAQLREQVKNHFAD